MFVQKQKNAPDRRDGKAHGLLDFCGILCYHKNEATVPYGRQVCGVCACECADIP